jgi:hypothetical protein
VSCRTEAHDGTSWRRQLLGVDVAYWGGLWRGPDRLWFVGAARDNQNGFMLFRERSGSDPLP